MELFTPGHLVILAIVALVLFFGWKQLPDMARSMGRSLRIFKTEIKGMTEDDKARDAARAAQPEQTPIVAPRALEAPAPLPPVTQAATRPRPAPRPAVSDIAQPASESR